MKYNPRYPRYDSLLFEIIPVSYRTKSFSKNFQNAYGGELGVYQELKNFRTPWMISRIFESYNPQSVAQIGPFSPTHNIHPHSQPPYTTQLYNQTVLFPTSYCNSLIRRSSKRCTESHNNFFYL